MAFADVTIANSALLQVGGKRIESLTETSTEAQIVNEFFEEVRRAVLTAHPWNCAIQRAVLIELSPPPFGFSRRFQLPTDNLRVLSLNATSDPIVANGYVIHDDGYPRFKIEGSTLVTNDDTANIVYIFYNKNPQTYSPLLYSAMAARLAAEIAWPIARSRTLAETTWNIYSQKLQEARSMDGMEGEHDAFIGDPLVAVR
jgi:hypothetical protein